MMAVFDEVKRVLKKTGTCWVVIGDTFGHDKSLCMVPYQFAIAMKHHGWILRTDIFWQKPNVIPSSAHDRFTREVEYVFFFVKSKKYYFKTQYEPINMKYINRYDIPFGGYKHKSGQGAFDYTKPRMIKPNPNGRIKRSVWKIPTSMYKDAHFAVFPEELIETPILAGCPPNGLILDPFAGSGTTAVVASKLGRNFFGIELNPEYIKLAEKRLAPYIGQKSRISKEVLLKEGEKRK
jgi:site-specific DNA-methyltransferase (adenine-specific)